MGPWIRAIAWLATLWMFARSLLLWGGLALTPGIGKPLREQASIHSPLVATYLAIGRLALPAVGLDDRARRHVAASFGPQIADTDSPPQTLVPRFMAAQSASQRLNHYGAPLMLVLSLVLHARRQRRIRSFGGRD
jgi:hypothetical protein